MGGVDKGVEDGVQQQLSKVVDGVGDEGGDAEVVGAGLAVAEFQVVEVNAGKEQQGVLVVCGELVLGPVVLGARTVERGMDDGLDGIEMLDYLLALFQLLLGTLLVP